MFVGENVKSDLEQGMAYVCSLCHKWLRAKERGESQCEAVHDGKSCAGPMAKMAFPQYEGPLEKAEWSNFCFWCGESSSAGIRVSGEFRMMGICERHLEVLETMSPSVGGRPLQVEHVDVDQAELIDK